MTLIVDIVISLAILCIVAGLWLSMPASLPFAPSQHLIDALPAWLQGPRRRIAAPKDEPLSPVHAEETQYHLAIPSTPAQPSPRDEQPASSPILDEIHTRQEADAFTEPAEPKDAVSKIIDGTLQSKFFTGQQREAEPAENVHDEP